MIYLRIIVMRIRATMRPFNFGHLAISLALSLLGTMLLASSSSADTPNEGINYAYALSSAFEKSAEAITPSVVNVSSVKHPKKVSAPARRRSNDPFFDPFREFFGDDFMDRYNGQQDGGGQQGLGTGVIVDSKGYILTNNHVVGEADEVTVRIADGRQFKAEVKGSDPKSDLAVIKINADGLTPAKLGDSDSLKIGEWVVAAGNPFGLDNTITAGIVSAKGRSISGGGQFEDFIQTDAAINPGNSGGPLINLKGEVIGINTAIFSRSGGYMGIGFAIPINMARSVMDSLISKGKVVRGWLGVGIQNLTEDLAQSFNYPSTEGALVGQISDGSPAARSGLEQGDIIVKFDGNKIKDVNQLRNLVAATAPGDSVDVDIIRDGRKQTIAVKIEELTASREKEEEDLDKSDSSVDLGLDIQTLTPELARNVGSKRTHGVVVTGITPGGLAEMSGIQLRDIIVSVNGKMVKNVKDFLSAVTEDALKKGVRIVVDSQGVEHFLFLRSSE